MRILLLLSIILSVSVAFYSPSPIMSPINSFTTRQKANAQPANLLMVNLTGESLSHRGDDQKTFYVPFDWYQNFPYRAVGKVWFGDDATYECSAAAVGGNIILTAGHCGAGRNYVKRFTFDPIYYNDQNNIEFHGYQMFATDSWRFQQNWAEDFAFVVAYKRDNKTLEETLGGALTFDNCMELNSPISLLGYPVTGQCNGNERCNGVQMAETSTTLDFYSAPFWGAQTTMGQGASGGPWVMDNTVCGLTSRGMESPYRLLSPTFTSATNQLYAQALQVDPPNWPH